MLQALEPDKHAGEEPAIIGSAAQLFDQQVLDSLPFLQQVVALADAGDPQAMTKVFFF